MSRRKKQLKKTLEKSVWKIAWINICVGKFLVLIMLIFLYDLGECKDFYYAYYDIDLIEVECDECIKGGIKNKKITKIEENGIFKYCFEDDMIKIVWAPTPYEINFFIQNKSNNSIKIIWDEATFVDTNDVAHRVIHGDVRLIKKNDPIPPTVIPSGATIENLIFPANNVVWFGSSWVLLPHLPNSGFNIDDLSAKANQNIGKTFKVILPLVNAGKTYEYIFTFKITNVTIKEGSPEIKKLLEMLVERMFNRKLGK